MCVFKDTHKKNNKRFSFFLAKGKGRNRDVIIWALYLRKNRVEDGCRQGNSVFRAAVVLWLRWWGGCDGKWQIRLFNTLYNTLKISEMY